MKNKAEKSKKKNNSAKRKALRLFGSSFIPLIVITFVSCTVFGYLLFRMVDVYIGAETSRLVQASNIELIEVLDPNSMAVQNIADFAEEGLDINTMDTVVHNYAEKLDYIINLYYATDKSRYSDGGGFVNSSDWVPGKDWNPKTRPWYKEAVSNRGKVIYTNPYIDDITGTLCATISKAAFSDTGKILGVCGLDVVLEDITEYLSALKISKNSKVYMINSKGDYLSNPDESKVLNSKFNYFKETQCGHTAEELLTDRTVSFVDPRTYVCSSKIGDSPWYIILEGPMSDYRNQLLLFVYIFEGALLIFSFICAALNLKTIIQTRREDMKLGVTLFEETQNLVVATKETAATSQDQSAAVKEIVATMEDSNALSENISTKIKDVSKVALKTSSEVLDGVAAVEKNVQQLHSIFDANHQTIIGMKDLGEKIDSIWDIVNLINSVADQAKIIAFNAEIEATSAGESGKKFRIVANEIRRLSDGIIDSTKEVKEKITEIQHSSDSLILASENGTEKINAGYETAKELSNHFASIKSSSEVTADSAGDITDIIQQQTAASEQILIALKQISAGVENFTVATNNISTSADSIRTLAEDLNSQSKIETGRERKQG